MKAPSKDYIDLICQEYGDVYDDREEDSAPGGQDWIPGRKAKHKSLACFQRELKEKGIELSTGKIRKILITGHLWTTESSRKVEAMYEELTMERKKPDEVRRIIAKALGISEGMVTMLLPYSREVYDVPGKSSNAIRCGRSRKKRKRVYQSNPDHN